MLEAVRAGHVLGDVTRTDRSVGPNISTDVRPDLASQPQKPSVTADGDLDVAFDVARVVGGHHVLAAILGPFHRTSDQLGAAGIR